MSKITAIFQRALGHLGLDFEDGSSALLTRGSHEHLNLKVGDQYPVKEQPVDEKLVEQQPAPEVPNASSEGSQGSQAGDAQVQSGDAPLGQQEGASGDQSQASNSDKPVGSGTEQEAKAQQDGPSAS